MEDLTSKGFNQFLSNESTNTNQYQRSLRGGDGERGDKLDTVDCISKQTSIII